MRHIGIFEKDRTKDFDLYVIHDACFKVAIAITICLIELTVICHILYKKTNKFN